MRRIPLILAGVFALACSGGDGNSSGNPGGNSTTGPTNTPTIGLSLSTANFVAQAGGASPAAQTVAVVNSGSGTLNGLAIGTIAYGAGQPTGWLAAVLSANTAPTTLTLAPTLGSLSAGTYTATVPIMSSATGVTNGPQNVLATFTVTSGAIANLTLATAGQSSAFLNSPNFAATLAVQAGQQYLIAVVNTDATYTQTEGFSLTGSSVAASAAVSATGVRSTLAQSFASARANAAAALPAIALAGQLPVSNASLTRMAQNHMAILDANNRIYQQAGSPTAAWAEARGPNPRNTGISAAFSPTVGTVNKLYVRNSLAGGCGAVDSIGARTVAIGQHVLVLADTNTLKWANAFRPDSAFYQTFANEYDQVTWPHLLANIGNPLVFDASLTSAGKVAVVITPTLNNLAGLTGGGIVVAFVNSCDFFPNKSASIGNGFSNQTEAFYSFVPSTNGYSVSEWEAQLRATAAHETKHIIAISQRIISNSPSLEQIWLEEGLAQESSEIWERNFNQATWLGHATFLQTAACEINLGANAPCDLANDKPFALTASHLPFFFQYLVTESTSNGEGLGLDTPSNYGAGWAFARWATDQYANGNEGAFVKSLINEPTLTGLANLSLHTGQSIPLLLTYFNVASAIFQTPTYTAADVRTTIPSFNFANIDSVGQKRLTCSGTPCGLFSSNGSPNPTYPVSPIAVNAATFTRIVNGVPGTAASYFLLTATTTGVETLNLLTPGGSALSPSSGLRVAILRVQ